MVEKQKKSLLLALLFLLAVLSTFVGILVWKDYRSQIQSLQLYPLQSPPEHISYSFGENRVELILQNGLWRSVQTPDFPLNQNYVQTMLEKISPLTIRKRIHGGADSLTQYGLDHPLVRILLSNSLQVIELWLGARNSATGEYYLYLPGETDVYTVDATFYNVFTKTQLNMAQEYTLSDIQLSDIQRVDFSYNDTVPFSIFPAEPIMTYGGISRYSVSIEDGTEQAADTFAVQSIFSVLLRLRLNDMRVWQPTVAQLELYGTDALHANQIELDCGQIHYTIYISKATQEESCFIYIPQFAALWEIAWSIVRPLIELSPDDCLSRSICSIPIEHLASLSMCTNDGRCVNASRNGTELAWSGLTEEEGQSLYYQLYALQGTGLPQTEIIGSCVLDIELETLLDELPHASIQFYVLADGRYAVLRDGARPLLAEGSIIESFLAKLSKG